MSWQQYVDEHLMVELPNGGQLTSAALIGQVCGVKGRGALSPSLFPCTQP